MQKEKPNSVRIQILSASVGSLLSAFVVVPFEVVKNRLQAQKPGDIYFTSSWDTVKKICKHEGVAKLWTGLEVSLVVAVPSAALYFSTYEAMTKWFKKQDVLSPRLVPMFSGLSARLITALLTSPFELVRTNMQAAADPYYRDLQPLQKISVAHSASPNVQALNHLASNLQASASAHHNLHHGNHPTSRQVVRRTIDLYGYRSLFQGLIPTLARDVPFSAIYWTLYEENKVFLTKQFIQIETNKFLQHKHPSQLQTQNSSNSFRLNDHQHSDLDHHQLLTKKDHFLINFLSGASSGICAAVCTQPIDVLKTRRQMIINSETKYSFRAAFMAILREEGVKGLFTGTLPRALKIAPACAVMISSYQFIKNSLT